MAGLFNRVGTNVPEGVRRIPIWALLNEFWLMLEGYKSSAEVIAHLGLTGSEVTDFLAILTKVTSDMSGMDDTQKASYRLAAFNSNWQTLVALERGRITEAQARTRLGI